MTLIHSVCVCGGGVPQYQKHWYDSVFLIAKSLKYDLNTFGVCVCVCVCVCVGGGGGGGGKSTPVPETLV